MVPGELLNKGKENYFRMETYPNMEKLPENSRKDKKIYKEELHSIHNRIWIFRILHSWLSIWSYVWVSKKKKGKEIKEHYLSYSRFPLQRSRWHKIRHLKTKMRFQKTAVETEKKQKKQNSENQRQNKKKESYLQLIEHESDIWHCAVSLNYHILSLRNIDR